MKIEITRESIKNYIRDFLDISVALERDIPITELEIEDLSWRLHDIACELFGDDTVHEILMEGFDDE